MYENDPQLRHIKETGIAQLRDAANTAVGVAGGAGMVATLSGNPVIQVGAGIVAVGAGLAAVGYEALANHEQSNLDR
jgi:hypothetical protein